MNVVCLDLEGVLVPEIWIAFAEEAGIPELKRTTRDEPDYDKLMKWRLDVLAEHGLGLPDVQATIAKIDPMPGARAFLDELRGVDALYNETGATLFCNELVVAEDGTITDFAMRCPETKLTTVRALHSCGMQTIAAGDSHNDLGMILDSKAGFLFRTTDAIKAEYPELPALETYDELLAAIKAAL